MQAELDHETSPIMAGLDRFVALNKPNDFPGKDSILNDHQNGTALKYVQMQLAETEFDAIYGCTIHNNEIAVGYTTSGGFGFRVGKSLALGYINADLATPGTKLKIGVLGNMVDAEVVEEPLFDSNNEKLRA